MVDHPGIRIVSRALPLYSLAVHAGNRLSVKKSLIFADSSFEPLAGSTLDLPSLDTNDIAADIGRPNGRRPSRRRRWRRRIIWISYHVGIGDDQRDEIILFRNLDHFCAAVSIVCRLSKRLQSRQAVDRKVFSCRVSGIGCRWRIDTVVRIQFLSLPQLRQHKARIAEPGGGAIEMISGGHKPPGIILSPRGGLQTAAIISGRN